MREIIGLMSNPRDEKKQSRNDSLQSKLNVGQSRVIIRSDKIIAIRDNSFTEANKYKRRKYCILSVD